MNPDLLFRIVSSLAVLLLMMAWEGLFPKRRQAIGRSRWPGNLGIASLNAVVTGFAFPVLPVYMAVLADRHGWGVLNQIALPGWTAAVIGVVVLDMIIYLQHAMFHAMPSLWRIHMMHHADHDVDVTTGLRFHPLEIVISLIIKLGAVALLGVPAAGVLAFEIILNGMSLFNHGNVRMPAGLDRILRLFVVTPDMHRVHHSVVINETNSNFGFNLSWWDFLFGTYRRQPAAGHGNMVIGASHLRERKWQNPLWMLALPFIADPGPYPLGRLGGPSKE